MSERRVQRAVTDATHRHYTGVGQPAVLDRGSRPATTREPRPFQTCYQTGTARFLRLAAFVLARSDRQGRRGRTRRRSVPQTARAITIIIIIMKTGGRRHNNNTAVRESRRASGGRGKNEENGCSALIRVSKVKTVKPILKYSPEGCQLSLSTVSIAVS